MRATGALMLLGTAFAGCGEPDAGEAPTLTLTTGELVEGNRVSNDPSFPNEQQSETSSVVQATTGLVYTAYNADDPTHVSYPTTTSRQICKNTSLAGVTVRNTNGTFNSMVRVPVPVGISALWGDPALAYANGNVFLSQLSSPTDRFNAASGGANCWTNSNGSSASTMLAGACIFQSTSQTSTPSFSSSVACVRSGNDFYDGGSLSGSGTSVMAAFFNVTQKRIDVYRGPSPSWTKVAQPFPGKVIGGHPFVLGGSVLVTEDTGGNLWITNYHANTNIWSTPVLVGGVVRSDTTLSNQTLVRSRGWAAALGGPQGVASPPTAYVAFGKANGALTQVRVATCNFNLQTGDVVSCTDQPAMASSPSFNAFIPSLGLAHPGQSPAPFTNVQVRLSFWTDEGASSGQARLKSYNLANPSASSSTAPQPVCPDTRGYWGDYDDTYVLNDFTPNPSFVRPYTDSTDQACNRQQYIATPQHVSAWTLPINDFVPLTLINGWQNAPFSTRNAAVAVINNTVTFRGAIANGTTTQPFTLPSGFRPPSSVYVPVDLCGAANGRLVILSDGTVSIEAEGGTFSNATCFTSLEGVSFALNTGNFQALTLQNGWTNAPFSTRNAMITNDAGIIRFQGAIATSGTNGDAFTLPAGFAPPTTVYVPVDMCGATNGRIVIFANGTVSVQAESSFSNASCFTSLEGASYALNAVGSTSLTLQNGWTNAPFSTRNAMAINDKHVVRFQGAIATAGTNSLAFTLPPELRPATQTYVPVDLCAATKGRLSIGTNGVVSVQAATNFSNASCFTSLEGAWFALQ